MHYDYVSIQEIPTTLEWDGNIYEFVFQESLQGTLGDTGQDLTIFLHVTLDEALHASLDQPESHGSLSHLKVILLWF